MGGLIFFAIPTFILIPIFLIGVGLAVSTTAKIAHVRGVNSLAYAVGAISLFAPLSAILVLWLSNQSYELERRENLARFQEGNVIGILGGQVVRLPASPQLETIHNCLEYGRCRTRFRRSGEMLQVLESDPTEEVLFEEVELIPIHETCEGSSAPINACLRLSKLREWCSTRVELSLSIWCKGTPRHRLVFVSAEQNEFSFYDDTQFWSEEETKHIGIDAIGAPITVECHNHRDDLIRHNAHLSRYCRISYNVSESIITTIFLDKFVTSEMNSQATIMVDYASGIWETIRQ